MQFRWTARLALGKVMSHIVTSTTRRHRESYRSAVYCDPPRLDILGVRSVVNYRL